MSVTRLIGLATLLAGTPLAAQSAWTKAPALPRACYRTQDTFEADVEKAKTSLQAGLETQEQTNKRLLDQVFNMDPATLNQRMMAVIQKDPAKAPEIMQAMQSLGTPEGQGAVRAAETEGGEFEAKKKKLMDDYQAHTKAVLGPIAQRAGDIENRTEAQRVAAFAELNRQYETVVCPSWFGKQIPDLLASYRTYLVEQRIPARAEAEKTGARMFELFEIPAKDFRPIAEDKGVLDYVRFASDLFLLREVEPAKMGGR
jgi:hypothetical protein